MLPSSVARSAGILQHDHESLSRKLPSVVAEFADILQRTVVHRYQRTAPELDKFQLIYFRNKYV